MMNHNSLHPAQVQAVEKLKRLRVGALYYEFPIGKIDTVLALVRYRLQKNKIDRVVWLCARRKLEELHRSLIQEHEDAAPFIQVRSIETLSHNLSYFLDLEQQISSQRTMLVIDDGLLIKNPSAMRTRRVIALSKLCPYRLLISPVPFTRRVSDMFSQWYALDERILGYHTYWAFCLNHLTESYQPRNMDYLARAIEPYTAQLLKSDWQPAADRKEFIWQFPLPPAAMREYKRVMARFISKAFYVPNGIYCLLQACQQVACGRRILEDSPLKTAPLYPSPDQDPRLSALLQVVDYFPGAQFLILCRYQAECVLVYDALTARFGRGHAFLYPFCAADHQPHFLIMHITADERPTIPLKANVIVHYSSHWDWRKRLEKENQCRIAMGQGQLTVVSLAAADTIDIHILRCIWRKESLMAHMRAQLIQTMQRKQSGDTNAQNL
ncbi:MAG: hypothetical protein E7324_01430 [Clostridiales bacterium]|nr:hypothetical protein [Clostridiales bacterium]